MSKPSEKEMLDYIKRLQRLAEYAIVIMAGSGKISLDTLEPKQKEIKESSDRLRTLVENALGHDGWVNQAGYAIGGKWPQFVKDKLLMEIRDFGKEGK